MSLLILWIAQQVATWRHAALDVKEVWDTVCYPSLFSLTVITDLFQWHWSKLFEVARARLNLFLPASYAAFVRHEGTHTTESCGHVRWNNELIAKPMTDLTQRWDQAEQRISSEIGDLKRVVKDALALLSGKFMGKCILSQCFKPYT